MSRTTYVFIEKLEKYQYFLVKKSALSGVMACMHTQNFSQADPDQITSEVQSHKDLYGLLFTHL